MLEKKIHLWKISVCKKLKGHSEYDTEKGYENDIVVDDITGLFVKQNGDCVKCGCMMKTFNYSRGDKKQFSIDGIDSKVGHIKGNIQLLCWGCNRSNKDRF